MRIVTIITVFLLTGCAISATTKKQLIHDERLSSFGPSDLYVTGVVIQCNEIPISFMMSLVIPLPPIIPALGMQDDNVRIHVNPENNHSYLIGLLIQNKNDVVLAEYDIPAEDNVSLNLEFTKSCQELDNSIVILTEQDRNDGSINKYKYILKYKKSDLEFNWGYLSA